MITATTKRPLLSAAIIVLLYLVATAVAPPAEFLLGQWR